MRLLFSLCLCFLCLNEAQAEVSPAVVASPPTGIEAYLGSAMKERRIPGMQVAVVRHGKVVLLKALGLADIESAIPVTNETVFPIASATKAFTGVALMQLMESGKLDLGAPVSRYLGKLPAAWQAVTVLQLATHISGLPNIVNNDTGQLITGVPMARASKADWVEAWVKVQTMPMEFSPGEKYSYNQTNYLLLGKIIDKLSGEPFTQFIRERQLAVVGMPATTYDDDDDAIPRRARGYSDMHFAENGQAETTTKLHEPIMKYPAFLLTAAGLNSTAEDIAKWIIALQGSKVLLDKSSLAVLWTPSLLNDGKPGTWGIGWPILSRPKHRKYVAYGGAKAAFAVYPDDDLAVVILTNLQGAMPERFIDQVAAYFAPGLSTDSPAKSN